MLDDVCAFAGAVAYEQARALFEIFGETVFVDDCRGCFGDLTCVIAGLTGSLEYSSVHFHAAGVDHRDDEAGIPDQVGDDGAMVGDDGAMIGCDGVLVGCDGVGTTVMADLIGHLIGHLCLGHEGVEGAHCQERLAAAEAEAFGCGYAHTKAGV